MSATNPLPLLLVRLAGSAIVLVACAWFINDALSFGLMPDDPTSGRASGCYTIVELWLGRLEPSASMRVAQLASSTILAIAAGVYGVLVLKRSRRA
jgi:hypothetical protein